MCVGFKVKGFRNIPFPSQQERLGIEYPHALFFELRFEFGER